MLAAHRFMPLRRGLADLLSITGFSTTANLAYTIAAGTWATMTAMPSPGTNRANPMGGNIGGLIYVCGGNTNVPARTATGYVYDPSADTWTAIASLATPTDGAAFAVYSGKLYVFGGNSDIASPTATCRAYNPGTDSWATLASLPAARGNGVAAAIGTKIYLTAALDIGGTKHSDLLEYDPAADTFTAKTGITSPVAFAGGAAVGGKFYVVGGQLAGSTITDKVQCYDPAANTWAAKAVLPMALDQVAVCADETNGALYATGGTTNNNDSGKRSEAYRYDVATDTWTQFTNGLPTPQYGHVLVGI